jgi:hypothetical protein
MIRSSYGRLEGALGCLLRLRGTADQEQGT